jgi:hypothetical protein
MEFHPHCPIWGVLISLFTGGKPPVPPFSFWEFHSRIPQGALPPLTPNYFLLLAQKKVIKEKGTTNDKFWVCLPTGPR